MLDKDTLLNYEKEAQYQKHMLDNLGRWFTLPFLVASIGIVLIYFFYLYIFPLLFLGVVLVILGVLGMFLFGYGIYMGQTNLNKIIDLIEMNLLKK